MARTVEISGNMIVYLFYVSALAIVPVVFYSVVLPIDDVTSVLVVVLLAGLILLVGADLWYWKSGELSDHLSTAAKRNLPYDITYDPTADPGQAAKHYWVQAVRRLPNSDDEDD